MSNEIKMHITEGVQKSGWNNTVRVFFGSDYSYGHFVPQGVVESFVGDIQEQQTFYVTKEQANTMIEQGQTYGEKRYFK